MKVSLYQWWLIREGLIRAGGRWPWPLMMLDLVAEEELLARPHAPPPRTTRELATAWGCSRSTVLRVRACRRQTESGGES